MKPALTAQQDELTNEKAGAFSLYRRLAVGDSSIAELIRYELLTSLFSNCPGLFGLASRAALYPYLFASCGKRPGIGRGVLLRRPNSVTLGSKVLIDDYAAIDVRGGAGAIRIGDYASIGRFTTVTAKDGRIDIENGVNIGSYCRIATQSSVAIGESTLIAAYAYIGPGNHQRGDEETPLIARDMDIRGGVRIGKHCWIGSGALILDGVTIGDGAIIGAQSLVKSDVPPNAVVAGTPAKVIQSKE